MSSTPINPNIVPMFGPDNQVHMVPKEMADSAMQDGELAHQVKDPMGDVRWVRHSQLSEATRNGGTVVGDMQDISLGAVQNFASIGPPEPGIAAAIHRTRDRLVDWASRGKGFRSPEAAANAVSTIGGILGPGELRAAEGITQLPQHPVRGLNNIVGGVGQTAALPLAATNPAFLPEALPYGIAQQGVQKIAGDLGADKDVAELMGNLAIPTANITMRGAKGLAKIIEKNPDLATHITAFAGGGSALYDLIHGKPLDAAKAAMISYAVRRGITELSTADVPNPARPITDYIRSLASSTKEQAPDDTGVLPTPTAQMKAKTPEAAQAEILKKIGVAGPKATSKPVSQVPPVTLKPSPDLAFATAKSGEDAATQQLMRYSINELRGIAMQRGLKIKASETQAQLVNKIGDNLTDAEVEAFDQARVERMQPRYGLGPEKLGPKPKQYMTEGSDLLKALSQMAGK